ncbi:MAG TPA: excalibur calcium-binding domain-containing protein [Thermomicrobiales bacterium]|jgi:hypothetical protein|nr:excalibur calcium-binding domain-containing protein [Thermomicrobiales bacterium]
MQRFIMAATMLLTLVLGLAILAPALVSAGAGNANCDDFASQQEAQRFFQDNGGSPTNNVAGLDDNSDGIACETYFGGGSIIVDPPVDGGPPVVDPVTCGFFETQADAQDFLDAGQGNPEFLDPDGDGYACEFRFGEVMTPPSEEGSEPTDPDDGEVVIVSFPITAYLCDSDPGDYNPNRGDVLGGGCVPADGISFTVAESSTGVVFGTCTTFAGRCVVDAPQSLTDPLVITEDVTTVPAGYAPRENPVSVINFSEFAEAIFFNIRTGEAPASETPEPTTGGPTTGGTTTQPGTTTRLPSTGSGTTDSSTMLTPMLLVLLAGVAFTLGATQFVWSHRQ